MFRFKLSHLLFAVLLIGLVIGGYMRIYRPGKISIRAVGEVVVAHDDIVSFCWKTQTLELRSGLKQELFKKLRNLEGARLLLGEPFQFCVDDDELYQGKFVTNLSSFSCDGIAISLGPDFPQNDQIQIVWDYPTIDNSRRNVDPRFHNRIYNSLWLAEKLTTQDGE